MWTEEHLQQLVALNMTHHFDINMLVDASVLPKLEVGAQAAEHLLQVVTEKRAEEGEEYLIFYRHYQFIILNSIWYYDQYPTS